MVTVRCRYVFEYEESYPGIPRNMIGEYIEHVKVRAMVLAAYGGGSVVCEVVGGDEGGYN